MKLPTPTKATRNDFEVGFQDASYFALPPVKDNVIAGSSSSPLAALGVYILDWRLTRDFFLMQHLVVYE